MFFFLSKTLGYLLKPLVFICGSFLLAWLLRNTKWKKRFFLAGMVMLLLFSNDFIANELMLRWEIRVTPFQELNKKYEYGILLCGAAKSDISPKDRVYIGSAADRINHTLQLYKLGHIKMILISGGSGRLIDIGEREADQLSSLLQLMGVPQEDIVVENNSRNTHESAVEVKKLLENVTSPENCILITSASHMRRSLATFAKIGWSMDHFSADVISHRRAYTFDVLVIPKIEAMNLWTNLFKEWTGYTAYWIAGYI